MSERPYREFKYLAVSRERRRRRRFKKVSFFLLLAVLAILVSHRLFLRAALRPASNESLPTVNRDEAAASSAAAAPLANQTKDASELALVPDITSSSPSFIITPVTVAASTSDKTTSSPSVILMSVPFTSQAPLAEWKDARQQDACEEAAAAMAMAWVKGESGFTPEQWKERILAIVDFEQKKYGESRDVSLSDMVAWIFKDYYAYDKVEIKSVNGPDDIIKELAAGRLVLTPMNGQLLGNPYYTPPGPTTHMLLLKGYDYAAREFVTNDAGTRHGQSYRYAAQTLFNAIRAYPTGYHEPIEKIDKEMLVVSR